jgi:hypothetical protein
VHHADDMMARITADGLVQPLEAVVVEAGPPIAAVCLATAH